MTETASASPLAGLGDLDGNGTFEVAVGAPWDDDGGTDKGAIWILSLNPDGTVVTEHKISATQGGFDGALATRAQFGRSLARLSDLDQNGVPELAVGAPLEPGGGTERGAVFVLFLTSAATVASQTKIAHNEGGLGTLVDGYRFGFAVSEVPDSNGDGDVDLSDAVALLNAKFLGDAPHVLGPECAVIQGCPELCEL